MSFLLGKGALPEKKGSWRHLRSDQRKSRGKTHSTLVGCEGANFRKDRNEKGVLLREKA